MFHSNLKLSPIYLFWRCETYQISPSRRRDFWRHPRNIENVSNFKINVLLYIMLIFACRFSFILLKPFIFLLLDSPKCSYKDPKILYGAVGEKLLLSCDMQPFSGPLVFNWTLIGNFVIYIYKIHYIYFSSNHNIHKSSCGL